LNNKQILFEQVLPEIAVANGWVTGEIKESFWKDNLPEKLKQMSGGDFDIMMAQIVIKASGLGVQGEEMTELVNMLTELREA
jgi:hypothetical protein